MLVDLIELDMLDFDIILGIDWLYVCFALIDCRSMGSNFNLRMKSFFSGREETQILGVRSFHI